MNALHGSEGTGSVTEMLHFFVYVHIYLTLGLWFATFLVKAVKFRKIRDIIGAGGYENVCYLANLVSDASRPLFWVVIIFSFLCDRFSNVFMPMVMLQTSAFFAQATFMNALQRGAREQYFNQ